MSYPLYSYKSGLDILDEARMNSLIAPHPAELVWTGTIADSKTGSGVNEIDCTGYSHCIRFTATSTTEMARIELDLASDGNSADLIIEIRSGMVPASGTDGTLLKSVKIPGSWIPALQTYVSIPISLTGLTAGNQYWIVVKKAGNSTDHNHLYGETSQDASYPCYSRSGESGAWTLENSIHFKIYNGDVIRPLTAITRGEALVAYSYTASGTLASMKYYIPTIDGSKAINETITAVYDSSGLIKRLVVS